MLGKKFTNSDINKLVRSKESGKYYLITEILNTGEVRVIEVVLRADFTVGTRDMIVEPIKLEVVTSLELKWPG